MKTFRIALYIMLLALTFLTGFCQGMNRGYYVALTYDSACQQQPNQCIFNNKE